MKSQVLRRVRTIEMHTQSIRLFLYIKRNIIFLFLLYSSIRSDLRGFLSISNPFVDFINNLVCMCLFSCYKLFSTSTRILRYFIFFSSSFYLRAIFTFVNFIFLFYSSSMFSPAKLPLHFAFVFSKLFEQHLHLLFYSLSSRVSPLYLAVLFHFSIIIHSRGIVEGRTHRGGGG